VDKLPYVRHDLELVAQREQVAKRVGRFDFGFDFGGPVKRQTSRTAYRADNYVLRSSEAPGFTAVDPGTRYREETGFGWVGEGSREAVAIPLVPYAVARAIAKNPAGLPGDVLWADSIRGRGAQEFAVKAADGEYRVQLLHPDESAEDRQVKASGGRLTIAMPEGEGNVSGIAVKSTGAAQAVVKPVAGAVAQRPAIRHTPPGSVVAGRPLTLSVEVGGGKERKVRLHYRAVNQLAAFRTIDGSASAAFTIPGTDVDKKWDLMYYFEVLDEKGGGWFQPDPLRETPYYVVTVRGE
jgi:hypothetical protein